MTHARSATFLWTGVCLVVIAVISANFLLFMPAPPVIPPGWTIIRPPSDVLAVVIHGDSVFAAGRDGVAVIDRVRGVQTGTVANEPMFAFVRALAVDPEGELWVGHEKGLTRCTVRGGTRPGRTFTREDGLPGLSIQALRFDRAGRLWIGTDRGAAIMDGDHIRSLAGIQGLPEEKISVVFEDPDGGIWVGTNAAPRGGLYVLREPNAPATAHTTAEGLPHNGVTDIACGAAGEVLVATGLIDRGGLAIFRRHADGGWRQAEVITKGDGLAGEKARSIFRDRRGVTWCGSEYDGLAYRSTGSWKVLSTLQGLPHNEVRVIVEDGDGAVWLGTMDGILKLDTEAVRRLP